eukprot:1994795-Amphidinium_carterae.1
MLSVAIGVGGQRGLTSPNKDLQGIRSTCEVRRWIGTRPGGKVQSVILGSALSAAVCRRASRGRCAHRDASKRVRAAALDVQEAAIEEAKTENAAETERDFAGRLRLRYQQDGWKAWLWNDGPASAFGSIECHYSVDGPVDGPPVVLVHGFGANAYHWRYQLPALAAAGYRVYALDLLGYGWGPRMVVEYTGEIWAAQISSFLREVVGGPATLVGNSVGAFVSLLTSAISPDQVTGLVMLNAAGRWEEGQQQAN